jgi:hypothetical protein
MSSRHHDRIRRLVAWMRSTSPTLLDTPPEEIEAAQGAGRRVLHVHFVSANAVKNDDPRVTNREGEAVTDCVLGG